MLLRINVVLSSSRGRAGATGIVGLLSALSLACVGPRAIASEGAEIDSRLSFSQPAPDASVATPSSTNDRADAAQDARIDLAYEPFGTKGQEHWFLLTGVGIGLEDEDATDVPVTIGWGKFIADDVEITAELTLWGHFQDGDDAAGINPGFNVRWHAINRERWTLFLDAGIGLLVTTDDVPDMGTSFNFTPRVGFGITRQLGDGPSRLIGGVRWHHISNARIEGEQQNPDRDGVLLYAGVMFPF